MNDILFLNGQLWNSPLFPYIDMKMLITLMQMNKDYYNYIKINDKLWKKYLKKYDNFELKCSIYEITQNTNIEENIIKIQYIDILKTINDKNFKKNVINFQTISKHKNDNQKEILENNYNLVLSVLFANKLYEGIVITIVDIELYFNHKYKAELILNEYTKYYKILSNSYAFFVYNYLQKYDIALKYIDFYNNYTIFAYIDLLKNTGLKSNIDEIINFETNKILVNTELFEYIMYIYYIDERYTDVIKIYNLYENSLTSVLHNHSVKMKYILHLAYAKLSQYNESNKIFEKIITEIVMNINTINTSGIKILPQEILNSCHIFLENYKILGNTENYLMYSNYFLNNVYPVLKTLN